MSMFCYQCEQTSQGTGCNTMGVCGKSPECAALQDLMVHICKGISMYAHRARKLGAKDATIDTKVMEALFMTLTNVNFDTEEHIDYIMDMAATLEKARGLYTEAARAAGLPVEALTGPAAYTPVKDRLALLTFAETLNIMKRISKENQDIVSLQELVTYGVKGLAAYAHHAFVLGYVDERVSAFIYEAFDYLSQPEQTVDALLGYALKTGEINLLVMEMLDRAHTETFGHPEPTVVRTTPVKGKCIAVSGHDLNSLHQVLLQTQGKGINVYTHGELLPALAYPLMKKFPHLVGNYGTAWQNQVKEFAEFPGSILLTTNCLKPPADSYKDRLFTMDVVGFDGVRKIQGFDFTPLIESALANPGYTEDAEKKEITIGFGRNAVLSVADKVVDAVKAGQIKHFFLIGGCDGAEFARNYFTELAEQVPQDCVIMTLGCGKYRFNMEEFGTIGGIPRLLDIGQCNDAYSAIKIASALADAFGVGVNDLPLSLVISWFEQKAVAVLLTLLFLGIKDIRLGPNLPAFVSPNVLTKLVEAFALKPTGLPAEDLKVILGKA